MGCRRRDLVESGQRRAGFQILLGSGREESGDASLEAQGPLRSDIVAKRHDGCLGSPSVHHARIIAAIPELAPDNSIKTTKDDVADPAAAWAWEEDAVGAKVPACFFCFIYAASHI